MGSVILLCAAKWRAKHTAGYKEKMRTVSRLHSNFSRIIRHELELLSDCAELNINALVCEY
jgi:hypothetical protein